MTQGAADASDFRIDHHGAEIDKEDQEAAEELLAFQIFRPEANVVPSRSERRATGNAIDLPRATLKTSSGMRLRNW